MITIKGYALSVNSVVLSKKESFEKYQKMFSTYFENIGNCLVDYNIGELKNTVLVFSTVSKIPEITHDKTDIVIEDKWNYGVEDTVWEFCHNDSLVPEFMRVEPQNYVRRLTDSSILISIKRGETSWVIAEYCPVRNILYTSDWTDDDTKIKFVQSILDELESNGLISKRKIEKKKPKVTLGADPEFELIDSTTKNIISCRDNRIPDRVPMGINSGEGRIGHDGAGAQRELRPEPSDSPEGLISNIEKLIDAGIDEQWSLKGKKYPLGGHIHIGGVEESREFGTILDHLLSSLFVLNSPIRQRSEYGKPGTSNSLRRQEWGVEWRTPPVGWLGSKKLARIVLKVVQLVAEKHYFEEDIFLTDNVKDDLKHIGLSDDEINTLYNEVNKFYTNGLPDDLKIAWGKFPRLSYLLEIRDTWNDDVKEYLTSLINKVAEEENFNKKIVLYGLSRSRGNVFSIVDKAVIGLEIPTSYGIINPIKLKGGIGVPTSIRENIIEVKKMEGFIIDMVKKFMSPSNESIISE